MTNTPLEVFTITPGRRYRFRLINSFGSVCPSQITFEGHSLTIIATDGEAVQPVTVDTIISFSGKDLWPVILASRLESAFIPRDSLIGTVAKVNTQLDDLQANDTTS